MHSTCTSDGNEVIASKSTLDWGPCIFRRSSFFASGYNELLDPRMYFEQSAWANRKDVIIILGSYLLQ
jgi:hypothetical protein